MGRYLVQTQMQTVEAPNSARLASMVQEGTLLANDLIKDLPDGSWVSARLHPEVGRLFLTDDNEQTHVVTRAPSPSPTLKPSAAIASTASTPFVTPEAGFWVRTRQSTVHVRDQEMLGRLCRMGVLQPGDGIAIDRDGPYDPLGDHVAFRAFFTEEALQQALHPPQTTPPPPPEQAAPPPPPPAPTAALPPPAPKAAPPPPPAQGATPPPAPKAAPSKAAPPKAAPPKAALPKAALPKAAPPLPPKAPPSLIKNATAPAPSVASAPPVVERVTAQAPEQAPEVGKDPDFDTEAEVSAAVLASLSVRQRRTQPEMPIFRRGQSGESRALRLQQQMSAADEPAPTPSASMRDAAAPPPPAPPKAAPPPLHTFVGPAPEMLFDDGDSSAETMAVSVDDLSSLDEVIAGRDDVSSPDVHSSARACVPSWDSFRQAMNAAARKMREEQPPSELTWDLFRAMMERSRPSGPTEKTWNHFRARIARHQDSVVHADDSAWDRFRALMTEESSERTWDRFVHTIRGRHASRGELPQRLSSRPALRWPVAARQVKAGPAIVGEARIKSVVVRRSDVMRPPGIVIRGLSSSSAAGASPPPAPLPSVPPPPPTRPPALSE